MAKSKDPKDMTPEELAMYNEILDLERQSKEKELQAIEKKKQKELKKLDKAQAKINGILYDDISQKKVKETNLIAKDLFNWLNEFDNNIESLLVSKNVKDVPVIYKITNIKNNKVYIGQTTRHFALRWLEHINSLSKDKFHSALRSTNIIEWSFSVIEVVNENSKDLKNYLNQREQYWISYFNSKEDGYNSL